MNKNTLFFLLGFLSSMIVCFLTGVFLFTLLENKYVSRIETLNYKVTSLNTDLELTELFYEDCSKALLDEK
tara:strand:- start:1596 stop:1808 length:213 start_codon:yes stop_codon:yes gene_type:complete